MQKNIFPLQGYITQEIINKANIYDVCSCIGALTLKEALGDNIRFFEKISWGNSSGNNTFNGKPVSITTEEDIYFMGVTTPQKVTFILK